MLEFAWSNLPNNLIQIGLTVSAAALVLFVLRRVLKKRYPARAICFVWALLAIRLLVPVQFTLPDPPVQITPPERTLYVTYRWNGGCSGRCAIRYAAGGAGAGGTTARRVDDRK